MKGKKILIIEDESIIAMGMQSSLEAKGYSIVGPAQNGKDAIDLASKNRPDLILADVLLRGEIDGIEAVKAIQETLDVPVVYLTAHTKESYFNRARSTKPYGYLIKPASQNEIYSTLELALYKHEMESRLKESEARYRSLVDNSLNAVAIYKPINDGKDFIFLDFNRSAERIEKVKKNDILGKSVTEVFPGVIKFGLFKVFQEVWKTGVPQSHPLAMYKDDRIAGWKENFVFKLPTGELVALYRDETKQRQAEESLRESEARFRAIISNSQVGYFFADRNGVIRQVNDAFLRMHKYGSADELLGKHYDILLLEADREKARHFIEGVLAGEIILGQEIPRQCKDGSVGYHVFSAYPVYKDGCIIGGEGFAIDTTEKRNIEAALQITNQLNKEIIQNAKIGIVVYDPELNYVVWNKFMEELTCVPSSQVLGKNARDFIPFLREQKLDGQVERALTGEIVYSSDFKFQIPGIGKTGWARCVYSPHYNADNQIIGAIELLSDVTETKNMGNALFESEKKYRELVENSNSIIFRRDTKGRITFINEFALAFFGYRENELLGKNVVGTIVPEYESTGRNLAAMVEDISKNPESYKTNINENMRKNGDRVWIAWANKARRDANGAVQEITCIGNDVTQRKMMEEELESSLREKEALIREIHHRIKNNMQVVSSLLSLQSTFVHDKNDLELFNECNRRVRSMALIHEMLYQSNNLARIDFSSYIDQIARQLCIALDKNSTPTQFEMDVRDILLAIDNAIPCALIINELLSNSLKHAFPEGRSGTIKVSFKKNPHRLYTLVISDDGIGIPENRELQNPKTMGLMIVNELVKQLRGTIQFKNTPGTRCTIQFPV